MGVTPERTGSSPDTEDKMTTCCETAANRSYYTDHSADCVNVPTVAGVYMTRRGEPRARGHHMTGWAAGSTDEGVWLTVWGSAYANELVFETEEAAAVRAEWLRGRAHESTRGSVVVRRVSRSTHMDAYRIL
jgi:hypothetical protein